MLTTRRLKRAACLACLAAMLGMQGALAETAAQAPETAGPAGYTLPVGQAVAAKAPQEALSPALQPGTSLTVATTSALTGALGMTAFGASAADMDAQALLHGYATVARNQADGFLFDPAVVEQVDRALDAEGNYVYTLTFAQDLTYNDGTPIGAEDYAFSMLLCCAPELAALQASHGNCDHIDGNEAYRTGEAGHIAGVRLLSAHVLSIRIAAEDWPLFYGIAMLHAVPRPIHVIAPGCSVRDDGEGIYLEGDFTAALLSQTLLAEDTGYLAHPMVTCGPYMLQAYDEETRQATFTANPRYKGNYEGVTPRIETVTMLPMENAAMIGALEEGTVDLLNRVTAPLPVTQGQDLASRQDGFHEASYLRDGVVSLYYACDMAPTDEECVRRALTMALDVDAFVSRYGGPSAHRVYGYYGLGQWMSQYTLQREDGTSVAVADLLPQLEVAYDPQAAGALLEAGGWTLNEAGEDYTPGVDAVRHKQTEAGLVPLRLRWAKTAGNETADAMEAALGEAYARIGAALEVVELPFDEVLAHFNRRDEEQAFHLFLMGNNFNSVYDPAYDFNTDPISFFNACGLEDEQLATLAEALRHVETTSPDQYVARWLQYQVRLMEVLPIAPLYSNVYFDFYTDALAGYDIKSFASWGEAILYAIIE